MSEELKPCPFCGGEAEARSGSSTTTYIRCKSCGCRTGSSYDVDKLKETWNRRAERTCQFFYDEKPAEYMCSACGEQVSGSNPDDEYEVSAKAVLEWFNFCPHCGARVIKEDS